MILISHRGNVNGKIESYENSPLYIDDALSMGYEVEIDVRTIEGILFLGHDEPQYDISQNWLNERRDHLWIHCKNIEAVEWFSSISDFNWFWHQNDEVTLTSRGFVWAYPGMQPIKDSIAVLPEIHKDDVSKCKGICSDYVEKYRTV